LLFFEGMLREKVEKYKKSAIVKRCYCIFNVNQEEKT
jgi:hypothetical protein